MTPLQISFKRAYHEGTVVRLSFWTKKPLNPTLAENLASTVRAFERTEQTLQGQETAWYEAGAVCCSGCMFGAEQYDLVAKQERRESWLRGKLGDDWRIYIYGEPEEKPNYMNLKQKAELFLTEFEDRTGVKLTGAKSVERVKIFQRLGRLQVDGDAGPKTFGYLRAVFPKEAEPAVTIPDEFPDAPLCSVEKDGVYPMASDHKKHKYRTTDGYLWTRDGKDGRDYHPAQDITRYMGIGRLPDSDGTFGAPKGSRVLACLPGVVVDIDTRGRVHTITLKHNTREYGLCYSYYVHIEKPAPGFKLGQIVQAGDFIAYNGATGTTLRHLHFSFHRASLVSDPWRADYWGWYQATAINLGGKDWDHYRDGWLNKWRRIFIAL